MTDGELIIFLDEVAHIMSRGGHRVEHVRDPLGQWAIMVTRRRRDGLSCEVGARLDITSSSDTDETGLREWLTNRATKIDRAILNIQDGLIAVPKRDSIGPVPIYDVDKLSW